MDFLWFDLHLRELLCPFQVPCILDVSMSGIIVAFSSFV